MGKFDGYLICTDLDGTLFRDDKTISRENEEAIAHFKAEGGIFTFITGRMHYFAQKAYDMVRPNGLVGCGNGVGLYDFEKEKYVWTQPLPGEVLRLVEMVDREFPDVGIQISDFKTIYNCKYNDTLVDFGYEAVDLPYHRVPEPLARIILRTAVEKEMQALDKSLRSHPMAEDYYFVRSERILFEILPKGICKGVAIEKLVEHLGIDPQKTIAIGDYYNDISMFQAAKLGIAVANACPEALEAADMVTVSNEEHAIARIIYDLEEGKLL